jgi:excisionase family DNA binding protein
MQTKSAPTPLAYSVEGAAAALSMSTPYLRREIVSGRLRVLRLGRRVLILPGELRRYLRDAAKENEATR